MKMSLASKKGMNHGANDNVSLQERELSIHDKAGWFERGRRPTH